MSWDTVSISSEILSFVRVREGRKVLVGEFG